MKKLYILLIVVATGLASLTGCSSFDEMNTSSTGLSKENIPPVHSFARMLYRGILYDHQRNMNLYDDLYSYYFADNTTWWDGINYAYNDGWAGCMWNRFYTESLQLYYTVKDYCSEADGTIKPMYKRMQAINDVGCVYLWTRLTDRFGDVPYTGAGLGETVPFTAQEEIYKDLLKRLSDDAAALKGAVAGEYVPGGNYDVMYYGDYDKWYRFANSLMLRLATRICKVDNATATTYAAQAISNGCFNSIDDVCLEPFDPTCFGDYYDRTSWDWGQTAPDANFVALLNGTNPGYATGVQDPRLPIFFLPANAGVNAGKYVGFPHGNAATAEDYALWTQGLTNGKYTGNTFTVLNEDNADGYFYNANHTQAITNLKYPVMTYSEVLFCKAELALRGIISGDAETLYKDGIRASVKEAAAHTAVCGKGLAWVTDSAIEDYITALPAFGSTSEEKFRSIMIQKWIALYPNSTEAWCESRRTGYPDMASGLVNYPGVIASSLVQDGNVIQRISYTDNAYNYESDNIPEEYRAGAAKNQYREQYGMFWSYAGKGGTFNKNTQPKNF